MTTTDPSHVLRLDDAAAELVAQVLTEAADQRTRAARRGAGALHEEAAAHPGPNKFDKRPAAVKITDLLAEANILDTLAAAARSATEPGTPPPPPRAPRTRKAAAGKAGAPAATTRPDGTRDPEAGPTAADAAIVNAAIEEFNATVPPLPDPDGVDGDTADLDPAEAVAAPEDTADLGADDEVDVEEVLDQVLGADDPDADLDELDRGGDEAGTE